MDEPEAKVVSEPEPARAPDRPPVTPDLVENDSEEIRITATEAMAPDRRDYPGGGGSMPTASRPGAPR